MRKPERSSATRAIMRLAGVLILAFFASAVAGALAGVAASLLPDWDEAAGGGLSEAFRAVPIAVYLILSVLLFGLALWRNDRDRHLKRALSILLLVPVLVVVLGVVNNGMYGIHWLREAVGAVQMFVPLWTVALVQWLILHSYLSRQTAPAEAASTNH
jgi:cell division protein FtsW (lipid II flippase)